MATVIAQNASQWLQTNAAAAQQYLSQGAVYDPATDTLSWPDGHANDTGGTGTIKPPSFTGGAGLQDGSGLAGTLQVNPGFQYDLQEREHAIMLELDKRQAELERDIQGINNDFTSRQNELNRQFQVQMAEQDRALQAELEAKRISSAGETRAEDFSSKPLTRITIRDTVRIWSGNRKTSTFRGLSGTRKTPTT